MSANLNIITSIQAFQPASAVNNPARSFVNWTRSLLGLTIDDAGSQGLQVAPSATQQVFSNAISLPTAFDSGSTAAISLSPLNPSRYRFTIGGTGALRTDRGLTLDTYTVTVAIFPNSTATFTVSAGGTFTGVVAGDTVFIPGVTTGDSAGPFGVLNEGFWTVLAVNSSTKLTVARLPGQPFLGIGEAVLLTSNTQLIAFSAAGVQVGNSANVNSTSSFTSPVLQTYVVIAVTPTWFEVMSAIPLPVLSATTIGVAGIVFFSAAPTFLYIEVDQNATVLINGDTGSFQNVVPSASGVPTAPGIYMKMGPVWSLSLKNNSLVTMNAVVITAG